MAKFRNNTFLSTQWTRYQPFMQMELPEFSAVLDRIQEFLQPVFEASIQENEFFMKWSATGKKWQE